MSANQGLCKLSAPAWRMGRRGRWSGRSGRSSRAARSPGLRPAAPRAVHRPPRCRRRGRVRRAGDAARPDGPGRLPAAPGRPPPRRGRLPGRLPRAGPQGRLDPRPRPAGQLALRRGAPHGPEGQGPARPPAQERGERRHRHSSGCRRGRADGQPAEEPAIAREQAEALHDEIDRLPGAFRLPVVLCYFEGLTLDEAARRLRCPPARSAAGWPGRTTSSAAASPAAASSCPPPPWPRSSTPGPPRRRSHPPCATSRPGPRSELRGRTGRFPLGTASPGPGGAEIHADPQVEIHRLDLARSRRRRHRRGVSDSLPGDEG